MKKFLVITAVVVVSAWGCGKPTSALANPTDADPYGVGPPKTCSQTLDTNLLDVIESLRDLDARILPVSPGRAADFAERDQQLFKTLTSEQMEALFTDPYYVIWLIHRDVGRLIVKIQQLDALHRRNGAALEILALSSEALVPFTALMGLLNQAALFRNPEASAKTLPLLSDEALGTFTANVQGIAMYLADFARCIARDAPA